MTDKKLITEVLSAHADHLLAQQGRAEDYARLFPGDAELPRLLSLADQVKSTLQPITPPLSFKEQLQRDLVAAAQMKQLEHARMATRQPAAPAMPLLISALVVAGAVLGGLFWLLWRQKNLPHSAR